LKVTIIGGGGVVGSSAAYRIAQDGLASEIVLVDVRQNMAEAHALDIEQAIVHRATTRVRAGEIKDTRGSNVIIIGVGAVGRPFHSSRANHFEENMDIMKNLMEPLVNLSPSALWMIATVPVDSLVYMTHNHFSIPREKVIGVNRNDTSRFRWAIAKTLSVPATSVEAFVLGEHGDTLVPIFSHVRVHGKVVSLNSEPMKQIRRSILDFLPQWIKLQPGRTAGWTTAESIGDILVSMASKDDRVWACSTPLEGEYGLREVSLGVPIRMGPNGVKEIIEFDLDPSEQEALKESAKVVQEQIIRGQALLKMVKH
jgi:malate/lactate dehydrogenase